MLLMKFSPSPTNINYYWNFGSILILVLLIQIVSGLLMSFHYNSMMEYSFFSVIHINREVNMGWMMRMIHINMASMFFLLMFIHISKSINNSSWKFNYLWISGMMLLTLSMMTAFLGYVLPWGQMSFWAATVITNLLSAIPYLGKMLVNWIWGGFSVSYPTLSRFYSLHFILPFIILLMIIIHITFLHIKGSSNPISEFLNMDKISFDPFFSIKDIVGFFFFFFFFFLILLLFPYYSVDSENFIEANPMMTPIHIKPEWYFLFAYAILRSIPNKVGGVLALMMSIMIFSIKLFNTNFKKMKFYYASKLMKNIFYINFLILTFLGGKMVEFPYETLSKLSTLLYFLLVMFM